MKYLLCCFFIIFFKTQFAQLEQKFLVEGIEVEGNSLTSKDAIVIISGLKIGSYITFPSPKVQKAIKNLLAEDIFYDISIYKVESGKKNTLMISLKEYLLLGDLEYIGLNSSEISKMQKNPFTINLNRYSPVSLSTIKSSLKKFLYQKGYREVIVTIEGASNEKGKVDLKINVEKGFRYKISNVVFEGNASFDKLKLLKKVNTEFPELGIKKNRPYDLTSKELKKSFEKVYRDEGFLDVSVDQINEVFVENKTNLMISINEGERYILNDFSFKGNSVFSEKELRSILSNLLDKPFSKAKLEEKLFFEEKRHDITSLYLDHGYANFKLKFRKQLVENNRLNIVIEMIEGNVYEFGQIDFKGNVRTKDKVLHQTVITETGSQFSRSKIILSQQKLMQLDYFVPEEFDIEMNIDTASKVVDVVYELKERISDRFLVSGGFDGQYLVGTVGFDFKNFELVDVFKKGARWNPLPAGGGQHLSLKAQSDATNYYGVSFLFEEPRLNSKRVGLSISNDYAYYTDGAEGSLNLVSSQLGVSHFPSKNNPFLRLSHRLNYHYYNPTNYTVFGFTNGFYNSITYGSSLEERTTNNAYFPTKGHLLKVEGVTTFPISYFKSNVGQLSDQDKYRWLEYYKIKSSFKNYISIGGSNKNVLASTFGFGFLGRYNSQLDIVPFERFEMGGTGITNFSINANDIIGLRGYEAGGLSEEGGDPIAIKMSVELRRKLLSFEKWMMTGHLFYENGNTFSLGNQLFLNHSAGLGAKLYVPMLGVVGVDCGWGFNRADYNWKSPTVQFTIGLDVGDF